MCPLYNIGWALFYFNRILATHPIIQFTCSYFYDLSTSRKLVFSIAVIYILCCSIKCTWISIHQRWYQVLISMEQLDTVTKAVNSFSRYWRCYVWACGIGSWVYQTIGLPVKYSISFFATGGEGGFWNIWFITGNYLKKANVEVEEF